MTTSDWIAIGSLVLSVGASIVAIIALHAQIRTAAKALDQGAEGLKHAADAIAQGAKAVKLNNEALEHSARANDLSSLSAVLSLESAMVAARAEMTKATLRVQEVPKERGALLYLENAEESWLNLVDRLCACIRWGYVPETRYRADYREYISDVYREYNSRTQFRHLRHVSLAWQDDRSAAE